MTITRHHFQIHFLQSSIFKREIRSSKRNPLSHKRGRKIMERDDAIYDGSNSSSISINHSNVFLFVARLRECAGP